MAQTLTIRKNTEHPGDALWWKPVFCFQKEMNELACNMAPEFISEHFWKSEKNNFSVWQENMHRLFCEIYNTRQMVTPLMMGSHIKPYIDITDKGDEFIIKAEVPGFAAKDFDISYADSAITIGGYVSEKSSSGEYYLHHECCEGSFCRTVALPHNANTAKASAVLDNNILTITVPKKQKSSKLQKLNIKAANDKQPNNEELNAKYASL